jgi:hypothetical protein
MHITSSAPQPTPPPMSHFVRFDRGGFCGFAALGAVYGGAYVGL